MTTVTISAEVALEEARADDAYHKQRCLILRKALADTEEARRALEKERDALLLKLAAKEPEQVDPQPKKKKGAA